MLNLIPDEEVAVIRESAELDDLNISSSELCQRPLTMKYLTDEDGNTCYDYFESTETTATA